MTFLARQWEPGQDPKDDLPWEVRPGGSAHFFVTRLKDVAETCTNEFEQVIFTICKEQLSFSGIAISKPALRSGLPRHILA